MDLGIISDEEKHDLWGDLPSMTSSHFVLRTHEEFEEIYYQFLVGESNNWSLWSSGTISTRGFYVRGSPRLLGQRDTCGLCKRKAHGLPLVWAYFLAIHYFGFFERMTHKVFSKIQK